MATIRHTSSPRIPRSAASTNSVSERHVERIFHTPIEYGDIGGLRRHGVECPPLLILQAIRIVTDDVWSVIGGGRALRMPWRRNVSSVAHCGTRVLLVHSVGRVTHEPNHGRITSPTQHRPPQSPGQHGLKGQNTTAQSKAQRRPGSAKFPQNTALKARSSRMIVHAKTPPASTASHDIMLWKHKL